ncbi:Major facilitator-type transporter hxnP [Fusarium oxysporum f. sp. albedinis]|nr:Major facilitator-type transporter hxnP [Fusarium oxysporum f. sp. albedinis]
MGELWKIAQRDIDEQEALYAATEQEESCIAVSLPLKARLESYLESRLAVYLEASLDSIYVDIARDCVEKIGLQPGV